MGVRTKTEPALEKVFPASDSAKQVRDALERNAREGGAVIATDRPVLGIAPSGAGWTVTTGAGEVHCRALIVCAGGKSYPKSGTTGDGYGWLRSLSLQIVDPVPALVPLVSPATWVTDLTGVSLDAEARVGKHRRRRPTLFTHTGLSGPAPMDLSVHITQGHARMMHLDLLPDIGWEELRERFIAAASTKRSPRLQKLIPLQRRLVETVARQAGLVDTNPWSGEIRRAQRHKLIELLKALPVPISGSRGFDKAEVTAGGLALSEVDRRTLAVKRFPGLYVVGELLDLVGPIGGLNFQAAFATAELAAHDASRYCAV